MLTTFQMRHAPFHHDHQSITDPASHTTREVRRLQHTFFVSFPPERKGQTGDCCFGLLCVRTGACVSLPHLREGQTKRHGLKQGTKKGCRGLFLFFFLWEFIPGLHIQGGT